MIKTIYRFFLMKHNDKKIKNLFNINKYLDKFDYSLDCDTNIPPYNSNYIWQFWNQGENNAPPIVKKCMQSVKNFNQDKNIIVLDDESIEKYIEIPEYIKKKYQQKIISKAHFSDYIRTCLLVKYGGIWIDATVLLTNRIPQEISNQDFFVFKNALWYNNKKIPSENLFKLFLRIDKDAGLYGSNWFIVSKPNNPILKLQKKLLEQYWFAENNLIYYFLYHLFISKSLIKNSQCKKVFEKMYSLSNKEPHMLQSILKEKYNNEFFEEIKNLSSIHKLTYKFEKIIKNSFIEYLINN